MTSIRIMTDSHSSITQEKAEELGITVLPMPFSVGGEDYLEGINLTRDEFFEKLRNGAEVRTSQPVPLTVMRAWDEALKENEQVVYIPISSGLSGSCDTALAMAQKKQYKGKVFVVDNGRVATPQYASVLDALELAEEGYKGNQIKEMLENARDKMNIYVAVDTLEHLKKGGRISALSAAVGSVLNIKPVLQFDVGQLSVYKKCRGFKAAKRAMLEAMKEELEIRFRDFYDRGTIRLLAASSADAETTTEWVQEIKDVFHGLQVMCEPLSMAISCHIGEGGLGIGCSCIPERR